MAVAAIILVLHASQGDSMIRMLLPAIVTAQVAFVPTHRAAAQSADTAGVSQTRRAFVAAVRAKDADGLARLVAEDAVMLRGVAGERPPVVGQAEFRAIWTDAFAKMSGPNPYAVYPKEVTAAASIAAETGEFGPEGGAPFGRYIFLYRLEATGWKVAYWKFYRVP